MPSLRAGFGVSCKSVTLPPTGVSVPFSAPKSNTSDWAMSAFVHFWPTWSCEGHLCLTFLWSLSSCPSIGWVLQSINENSQLSSGPPRNPGCMFALKGFTGGPFKCASVRKKGWMGRQCTPLRRQSDCGFPQSFPCGDVKQNYQWRRGWAGTNAPIKPSTVATDAATSVWNHGAKFTAVQSSLRLPATRWTPFSSLVPAGLLKLACRRYSEGKRNWVAFISNFS